MRASLLALGAAALAACMPGMQRPDELKDPLTNLDVLPAAPAAPVARTYNSQVDRPRYKLDPDDDRYAIVVGIQDYEGLPSADYAERDATAVRDHLLAMGYPERNVVLLTGRSAGRAAMEKYLESWLPERVDAGSRVFFYFSGHGAPDVASSSAYLLPWDGDPKFLGNTAYPVKRLYGSLNALKAKQVLVALDACFSGAGGRSVLPKGARPLITKLDTANGSLGKLVVLAAAGADEITGSLDKEGHGAFTYYMLAGLNARGGDATAKQLYDYLVPKVEDAARADNRDQRPRLLSSTPDGALVPLR